MSRISLKWNRLEHVNANGVYYWQKNKPIKQIMEVIIVLQGLFVSAFTILRTIREWVAHLVVDLFR